MQALGNNLFFDTLNALSIKVLMHFQSKPQAKFNNTSIELNRLFANGCLIQAYNL